jgi:hypothetical protein
MVRLVEQVDQAAAVLVIVALLEALELLDKVMLAALVLVDQGQNLLAVAVGQEVLALKTVFGGALIVLAMFVVEWPTRKPRVPRDV